jgi:Cof subfamily protein (haloacid dehalogenase superfamily)
MESQDQWNMPYIWSCVAEPLPSWRTADVEELRIFARIQLIAFDLDGTLLTSSRSEIPAKVAQLRRALAHRQPQFQTTIATGRAFHGVEYLLADLRLREHTPVIIYNGSVVWLPRQNRVLRRRTINKEALRDAIKACLPLGATILAYYFPDPADAPLQAQGMDESVSGWSDLSHEYLEYNGMPISWHAGTVPEGCPVSMLVDTHGDTRAQNEALRRLSRIPSLSSTSSGYSYLEVRPDGVNKGLGLSVAAGHLGLDRSEVLAVGDNDNDAEMLKWAGIGVAVSSASQIAIANSGYVCGNGHGVLAGAVEVMRLVHQAKRYYGGDGNSRGSARQPLAV